MMSWMWYNGWQSGWVGVLMGLMMLLFWAAVIGVIYLALRSLIRNSSQSRMSGPFRPEQSPLDILNERYAKGELSDGDYDRIKQRLYEGHPRLY